MLLLFLSSRVIEKMKTPEQLKALSVKELVVLHWDLLKLPNLMKEIYKYKDKKKWIIVIVEGEESFYHGVPSELLNCGLGIIKDVTGKIGLDFKRFLIEAAEQEKEND